ncbi:hypothetical protein G3N55_11555 [Dissulfurirhabdus thermomarina]|uniref:Uncharacterized protein n=1 Tax=Dissulfurirhabdus thermomarina TaxID=1765737 RepID=A0A6N9TTP3_DISTH|nr:hypothetical protein [Dissulfurirhabdus thermomarina]NDY43473.1 hypothetical protein [Dissulfurirhabdus thermomarina]NMX23240.1 hypothetical protein [Dissulfurirhabdus thermomarina]
MKSAKLPPDPDLRRVELRLKVTKEIVVKFIEMGRVTPASFEEVFDRVYKAVARAEEGGRGGH